MSGPTNYSSDGKELFTEEKPAIVQLADLMDFINEMRDKYDDIQEISQIVDEKLSIAETGIMIERKRSYEEIRRETDKGNYKMYETPSLFTWKNHPLIIYKNGINFTTTFDVSTKKNISGNVYYVDPVNGNNLNDGSLNSPFNTIEKAYNTSQNGDTIFLKDGVYYRDRSFSSVTSIKKSLNIIGIGEVVIPMCDKHIYTKTANTQNVYQTNRTNVLDVVDYRVSGYGSIYKKVGSISECDSLKNSYYTENGIVYIHTSESTIPNDKIYLLLSSSHFKITNTDNEVKFYIENITIIGGNDGNLWADSINPVNFLGVYGKSCRFLYTTGVNGNADSVNIDGADEAIFQKCDAMYSRKDGFNYTSYNSSNVKIKKPNFIEIDCVGAYNGLQNIITPNVNNGSTAHEGAKGIRINGKYFKNMGSNVADVQTETETLNLGCLAYDSQTKLKDQSDTDFCTQQAGAKMFLDSCVAFGSYYSVYAVSNSRMIIVDTQFDTKQGGGLIEITNKL